MITVENSFLADKSAHEVYRVFSDVEAIARAFPTVTRIEVIDADHVNLGLLVKLGLLPLDNNVTLAVTERTEPKRLIAEGVALPGKGLASVARVADKGALTKLSLILELEELSPDKCRVYYKILADAHGNLKRVYDAVIKGQRAKMESEFIKNVSQILGAPIVEEKGAAKAST